MVEIKEIDEEIEEKVILENIERLTGKVYFENGFCPGGMKDKNNKCLYSMDSIKRLKKRVIEEDNNTSSEWGIELQAGKDSILAENTEDEGFFKKGLKPLLGEDLKKNQTLMITGILLGSFGLIFVIIFSILASAKRKQLRMNFKKAK